MAKGFVALLWSAVRAAGSASSFAPRTFCLSHLLLIPRVTIHRTCRVEKCSGCDLCGMYCPDFAIFGARYAR